MTSQVAKWGNSLAVRIPKSAADAAGLREGEALDVRVDRAGVITLRRRDRDVRLAALVAGITTANRHGETAWGPAVGGEEP